MREKDVNKVRVVLSMKESSLCRGLNEEQCSIVYKELKPEACQLEKGQVLYYTNDRITKFGLVIEGAIASIKNSASGKETINRFYRANRYFAVEFAASNMNCSLYEYRAKERSLVSLFDYREFINSKFDQEIKDIVMANLINMLTINNRKNIERIEILEENSLRQRILLYLEVMSKRKGSSHYIDCKNREEMAAYLSVNRSALSNELRRMKDDKLIDFHKNEFWLQKNY